VSPAPHNRTVLAFLGSGSMVLVAVQAPALIPALALSLGAWAALYQFLRL